MFKRNDDGSYSFSRRFWTQIIVLGLVILAIAYSTQRTAHRTEQLSRETISYAQRTNDCLNQVLSALKIRSRISEENDEVSQEERTLVFQLLTEAVSLPPEIAVLPIDDPRRQRWNEELVFEFLAKYGDAERRMQDYEVARQNNPYPEPNCGLKLPGEK